MIFVRSEYKSCEGKVSSEIKLKFKNSKVCSGRRMPYTFSTSFSLAKMYGNSGFPELISKAQRHYEGQDAQAYGDR